MKADKHAKTNLYRILQYYNVFVRMITYLLTRKEKIKIYRMPQSKTNSLRELIMTFPANDSHKFHSFYFSLCLSFKRFSFEKKCPLICNVLESLGFTSFYFFQISFHMNVPIDFLKFCHINFDFFLPLDDYISVVECRL